MKYAMIGICFLVATTPALADRTFTAGSDLECLIDDDYILLECNNTDRDAVCAEITVSTAESITKLDEIDQIYKAMKKFDMKVVESPTNKNEIAREQVVNMAATANRLNRFVESMAKVYSKNCR